MIRKYFTIKIENIDLSQKQFNIRYPVKHHSNWIDNYIDQPIWLLNSNNDKFIIADGFRRVNHAIDAGLEEVDSFLLTSETEAEIFKCVIIENSLNRKFNVIEKSNIIYQIINNYGLNPYDILKDVEDFYEVKNSYYIQDLLKIYLFPEEVKNYLALYNIPINHAIYFDFFLDSEKIIIAQVFEKYKLGTNKMKIWIDYLLNIRANKQLTPLTIFQSKEIIDIEANPKLSNPQKSILIEEILKHFAYPIFSDLDSRFLQISENCSKNKKLKFSHAKNFEGNNITCNINFASIEEFMKLKNDFQNIENDNVKSLLEIIKSSVRK